MFAIRIRFEVVHITDTKLLIKPHYFTLFNRQCSVILKCDCGKGVCRNVGTFGVTSVSFLMQFVP